MLRWIRQSNDSNILEFTCELKFALSSNLLLYFPEKRINPNNLKMKNRAIPLVTNSFVQECSTYQNEDRHLFTSPRRSSIGQASSRNLFRRNNRVKLV